MVQTLTNSDSELRIIHFLSCSLHYNAIKRKGVITFIAFFPAVASCKSIHLVMQCRKYFSCLNLFCW